MGVSYVIIIRYITTCLLWLPWHKLEQQPAWRLHKTAAYLTPILPKELHASLDLMEIHQNTLFMSVEFESCYDRTLTLRMRFQETQNTEGIISIVSEDCWLQKLS